jgi:hypothetical protein
MLDVEGFDEEGTSPAKKLLHALYERSELANQHAEDLSNACQLCRCFAWGLR